MRGFLLPNLFIALLFFTSCGGGEGESEESDLDLQQSLDSLSEDLLDPIWRVKSDSQYCQIEIPQQMEEMDELNPTATIEYGYFEDLGGEVKENYIIVIPHTKEDLEAETPGAEYTVTNYSDLSLKTLMANKESYKVLNEVEEESINGMPAMIHEIQASIHVTDSSHIDVFYMLGVFEGEKAFYQVLSWTLFHQKGDFRNDMRHMMYSFKEEE